MIYIWDNGGSYSDHALYFVESDLPREDVETIMAPMSRHYIGEARIVGVSERVEWREGANCQLADWCASYLDDGHNGCVVQDGCFVETKLLAKCNCARRPSIDAALKHGLIKVEEVAGG